MRILITTESFPPKAGGSGWSTYTLAQGLRARGHQIQVAVPRAELKGLRVREFNGLPITELGYRVRQIPGARAYRRRAALNGEFVNLLTMLARDFDVIHAQHLLTLEPSLRAARRVNLEFGRPAVPVVSTVRDYWPICVYGTLWREGETCPGCQSSELLRCLRQRYGAMVELARPLLPLAQRELATRQQDLGQADTVIVVSRYVANKLGNFVRPERVKVIPNLVEFADPVTFGMPPEARTLGNYILFAGKLNQLKGADLLPQIMRKSGLKLPLVVAGEGPLESTLRQLPGVRMLGWRSNTEVLGWMAGATALIFPSRWAEPLARTLLEAQAVGVPSVALNTGGTPDIIEHEVNGLLAEGLEGMAQHLARLAVDKELNARLRMNARLAADQRFSASAILPQFEAVYEGAAAGVTHESGSPRVKA